MLRNTVRRTAPSVAYIRSVTSTIGARRRPKVGQLAIWSISSESSPRNPQVVTWWLLKARCTLSFSTPRLHIRRQFWGRAADVLRGPKGLRSAFYLKPNRNGTLGTLRFQFASFTPPAHLLKWILPIEEARLASPDQTIFNIHEEKQWQKQ